MMRLDAEVLDACREDLLHPAVVARAFEKLRRRLDARPAASADRRAQLTDEADRIRLELARLSGALASGDSLPSVLDAIRERERRRATIAAELAAFDGANESQIGSIDAAWPQIQRRIEKWRGLLSEDTGRARQMLRTLLDGRLVFTPRPDRQQVEISGQTDYGRLLASVVDVSVAQALASLPIPSWNQINVWLRAMAGLRQYAA